ncbi:hypothetical protein ASPBRDRAFT_142373 [Aspergillus brasiliensis CBS 101740]|uniref:Xaa-Pro dipeptidyl-peptidase C-terminal domain-containing protein n=1 Tax=Aspergillus brasiliensis (strain CBS 101740 / IMI 381727 / IBT 21946) TaxID=767769 RepID=A0A1L9V257_ASPBC|nr:hypothetical protein ASPBRDRAFT_142373 [Aspergillus brasiliensis CBS 101740]
MSTQAIDAHTIDTISYPYIFEKNVSVPLKNGSFIRCNVYRPKTSVPDAKHPVLATYGPYGKDVHYSHFNPPSYAEVNPDHKTEHSAWETPTPSYWTQHGYAVVRADETGTGQSPGFLDTLSTATIDAFYELIEWASEQTWSNGKVGLLGISYFGATQWQVAARRPKGLAAIVPWEGFSDFYRDACRHGGILSNGLDTIWKRQVGPNQYGLAGRAARNRGDDTIEGSLSADELAKNRASSEDGPQKHRFRDSDRFASVNFNLEDIQVPLLSVANWGGILLHLRGNVQGYIHAGSELKYLRFIVGRHDLPFYYAEEVEIQRSFLDAFLLGQDRVGWSKKGAVPPVDLILRKGNVGFNDPKAESQFLRRKENEWPIARTQYTPMFLHPDGDLSWEKTTDLAPRKVEYQAFGDVNDGPAFVSFTSAPFDSEKEITGHIVVQLNVSVSRRRWQSTNPTDIDLFLSLRHLSSTGDEVFYTGTAGDPAPVTKGFLRVSLRKTNPQHPHHRPWLPHRDYYSTDVLPVIPNEVYTVDVELWPTNVVVQQGERLVLDIGASELPGSGIFQHNDPSDRPESVFQGNNHVHFGPNYDNFISLPIIPNST